VSCFYIHPEEARDQREWKHESREYGKIFDRRVGLEFEYALEGIFHRVDILLYDEDLTIDLIELIFEILEVRLYLFSEHICHTDTYELHHTDLR
jgi:hypothetical protein